MTTRDKVTEIFCIIDEFGRKLNVELSKTYVYHPIAVMENIAGIVREGFLKVKS